METHICWQPNDRKKKKQFCVNVTSSCYQFLMGPRRMRNETRSSSPSIIHIIVPTTEIQKCGVLSTKVWLPQYKSVALKVKLLHYIIFSLHSDIYYCIFQYDNMASDMASQIPSIFIISTINECHKKKQKRFFQIVRWLLPTLSALLIMKKRVEQCREEKK